NEDFLRGEIEIGIHRLETRKVDGLCAPAFIAARRAAAAARRTARIFSEIGVHVDPVDGEIAFEARARTSKICREIAGGVHPVKADLRIGEAIVITAAA